MQYTHLPTGVAAESRCERSQHKNDANALAQLKAKLVRLEEEKGEADFAKKYDEKGEISFGSQIRSYVLQPYQLVKDLRNRPRGWQTSHRSGRQPRRLHRGLPQDEARRRRGEVVSDDPSPNPGRRPRRG